jgi:hypothetical protein
MSAPAPGSAEYQRNHLRVRRLYGRASEWQCYFCPAQASDWAYLWRTHPDPADPESYAPLCRSDHTRYDYRPRVPLNVRALVRAIGGSDLTPATLADIVGVAPRTFACWLLGEATPRKAIIRLMAQHLGVTPDDLLTPNKKGTE